MPVESNHLIVLLAEDDDDDYLLARDAFIESHLLCHLVRVKDGEELMEYLLATGGDQRPAGKPRPSIIMLDLNMPKKDGREALKEIKNHPRLRSIPVVVLTTSRSDEDVVRSYEIGVNSFIRKPVSFEKLVGILRVWKQYWIDTVELPIAS